MILFKKWVKYKVKSYIYYVNQFLPKKRHKKWNQELNKNSLFCSIYAISFIFWPLELRKKHGDPLFLNLIFTYFPLMNNSGNFKEISSTSFYCIVPP